MADKLKPPAELGAKYIEIVLDENGDPLVEVHGCTDAKDCQRATAGIERALGVVSDRKVTVGPTVKRNVKL